MTKVLLCIVTFGLCLDVLAGSAGAGPQVGRPAVRAAKARPTPSATFARKPDARLPGATVRWQRRGARVRLEKKPGGGLPDARIIDDFLRRDREKKQPPAQIPLYAPPPPDTPVEHRERTPRPADEENRGVVIIPLF